jgi:hypothetical protein
LLSDGLHIRWVEYVVGWFRDAACGGVVVDAEFGYDAVCGVDACASGSSGSSGSTGSTGSTG